MHYLHRCFLFKDENLKKLRIMYGNVSLELEAIRYANYPYALPSD